jgi:2-oxoglutarate dehydrogenase complex dehydrogenase (E1) component-like enzyme
MPRNGSQSIQSCNMVVANPTTPANYYHLLKRQITLRKPCVVVGPKTLLRLPAAISTLDDLAEGKFQPILTHGSPQKDKRVILVSGKIYYDLVSKFPDDCIIRIEQLNPFPADELREFLNSECGELIWFQEEPENMGAYSWIEPRLRNLTGREIKFIGRPPAASPATGIPSKHKKELEALFGQLK